MANAGAKSSVSFIMALLAATCRKFEMRNLQQQKLRALELQLLAKRNQTGPLSSEYPDSDDALLRADWRAGNHEGIIIGGHSMASAGRPS